MNSIYLSNDLTRVKLGRAPTFMKYLTGIVSLIFLQNTLIRKKITFWLPNFCRTGGK